MKINQWTLKKLVLLIIQQIFVVLFFSHFATFLCLEKKISLVSVLFLGWNEKVENVENDNEKGFPFTCFVSLVNVMD